MGNTNKPVNYDKLCYIQGNNSGFILSTRWLHVNILSNFFFFSFFKILIGILDFYFSVGRFYTKFASLSNSIYLFWLFFHLFVQQIAWSLRRTLQSYTTFSHMHINYYRFTSYIVKYILWFTFYLFSYFIYPFTLDGWTIKRKQFPLWNKLLYI